MLKETIYDPIFDSHRHFRVLLDVMARPSEIRHLNGVAIEPPNDPIVSAH